MYVLLLTLSVIYNLFLSILPQVHNHMTVPVEVYCRTEELQKVGPIPPSAKVNGLYTLLKVLDVDRVYDVPLFVAYHCKLYVAPAQIG